MPVQQTCQDFCIIRGIDGITRQRRAQGRLQPERGSRVRQYLFDFRQIFRFKRVIHRSTSSSTDIRLAYCWLDRRGRIRSSVHGNRLRFEKMAVPTTDASYR